MNLNISKRECIKKYSNKIIARCPACFQEGHDNKGEHLFIANDGSFGCVVYPDELGKEHRKKIFALIGESNASSKEIFIQKSVHNSQVLEKDILGHLGRVKTTSYKIFNEASETNKVNIIENLFQKTDANNFIYENEVNYSPAEIKSLKEVSVTKKDIDLISEFKKVFVGSTVLYPKNINERILKDDK